MRKSIFVIYNTPEKLGNRIVNQRINVIFALNEGNTLLSTRSEQVKDWTTVFSLSTKPHWLKFVFVCKSWKIQTSNPIAACSKEQYANISSCQK